MTEPSELDTRRRDVGNTIEPLNLLSGELLTLRNWPAGWLRLTGLPLFMAVPASVHCGVLPDP